MQVSNAYPFALLNLVVLADYSDQEWKRRGVQRSEFDLRPFSLLLLWIMMLLLPMLFLISIL